MNEENIPILLFMFISCSNSWILLLKEDRNYSEYLQWYQRGKSYLNPKIQILIRNIKKYIYIKSKSNILI